MKKLYAILIAVCSATLLAAQPAGWNHVVSYSVQNNAGIPAINYQLRLVVNTQTPIGAGQMNAAGDDIRFGKNCTGTTLFNYWIETGINTPTTVIWVKMDTLPATSAVQIFMYYGNASATAASAVPGVFIGPHSSTDSVASGGAGGVTNSQRGFRFSPNEDLLVTAFGKNEPTGTTRYITLFDFNTQAILTQTQVSGPAAQYSYGNIAQPMWLIGGTQYVLELYQGASDGYYFGTSSQIGQHITYGDMRYCNSCTENTFPTNTLTNYHYGYPDLWYWTKTNLATAPTVTAGTALAATASAPSTICEGDSAAISVSATGGSAPYLYAWSPGAGLSNNAVSNPMASPALSTTYTATVTDGCGSTFTATVAVNINALPSVTAGVSADSLCSGASFTPMAGGANSYTWSGGLTDNVPFTPAVTDTYTVTGTDANGCSADASVTVTVLALPSVTANATATAVCEGDTVIFTGGGAAMYTWTNGVTDNAGYVPTATMSYEVTGTDSYGCVGVDSIAVTVNPLPVVALSGPSMACDMDAAFTLTGTPAGGIFAGPGVTGNSFDPSVAGSGTHTLTYMYTDSAGCSAMDSISVVVDLCLSVVDGNANALHVFPNPFGTELTMNLAEAGYVRMFSSLGAVVFEQKMNAGRNEINTQEFARGVYTLTVTTASGTATIKVVKQ